MPVRLPMAKSGAAFMSFDNSADADDRLIGVTSDAAQRVELHTHMDIGNGVMQMIEVEDGMVIPAGGVAHADARRRSRDADGADRALRRRRRP